ncbi:hypothetical protein MYIN104542_20025 [Mycobacterium intermedium]
MLVGKLIRSSIGWRIPALVASAVEYIKPPVATARTKF